MGNELEGTSVKMYSENISGLLIVSWFFTLDASMFSLCSTLWVGCIFTILSVLNKQRLHNQYIEQCAQFEFNLLTIVYNIKEIFVLLLL